MKKYYLLLTIFLFACSSKNNISSDISFPIYGNYCGPLYPPKGSNPIPIDSVDSLCMNHDKCYEEYGYFNKKCDAEILKNLKNLKTKTVDEALAKKLLITYFKKIQEI